MTQLSQAEIESVKRKLKDAYYHNGPGITTIEDLRGLLFYIEDLENQVESFLDSSWENGL